MENVHENPPQEVVVKEKELSLNDFPETREASGEKFNEAAKKIQEKLLELIRERFDTPNDGWGFHNSEHTKGVINKTKKIIEALRKGEVMLSNEDAVLAEMLAAGHDTVQSWEAQEILDANAPIKRTFRKRARIANEEASTQDVLNLMHEANASHAVFTQADVAHAVEAMNGTIPNWDAENKTVSQPITEQSGILARIVALADLGDAGMDTKAYLESGLGLFREEQLDLHNINLESLSSEIKAYYTQRMYNWIISQVTFAQGRKARYKEETAGLPETLAEVFSEFDGTITAAQQRAKQWKEKIDEQGEADACAWCLKEMGL
ncbi:MAG: hypothetical protein AAB448_01825 [Patescibacteria group bacterium]